jgi:hypothetical protein
VNPYVFFVGCPRSGTTLLRRIGDAHPELAIIRELHWLPLWWKRRVGITSDGFVTKELVTRLVGDRRFRQLEVPAERVAELVREGRPKHYTRFVTELFDLHGEAKGKRLVGEKTPRYVRHVRALHSLWPQAKIVHLIRDGRDVCLSLLDWSKAERDVGRLPTWDEDRVTTAALYWEWNVRLGREAGVSLRPDLYYELRYESLVADPEAECAGLCRFLGIRYDDAMLRFHEGRAKAELGLSAKKARLPVTAGLRRWHEQMTPDDARRFEAAAGPLLGELDYPRTAASLSEGELERAAHLRDAVSGHIGSRRRTPDAWRKTAA